MEQPPQINIQIEIININYMESSVEPPPRDIDNQNNNNKIK